MSCDRLCRLLLACALLAPVIVAHDASAAVAPDPGDPLAIGKLQSEVSFDMRDVDVVQVFRLIAKIGAVPFVLDFEDDPALKVTVRAQNSSLRMLLQSLADTYGFEYEPSEAGILVRRHGTRRSVNPVVIGSWPATPGKARYRLEIEAKDPTGTTVGNAVGELATQSLWTYKQGTGTGREVTAFDRERLIAEKRFVGTIQVNLCIKKETTAGLELLYEAVVENPLGDGAFREDHTVTTKTVGAGEAVLFRTQDGYEIRLRSWSRAAEAPKTDATGR